MKPGMKTSRMVNEQAFLRETWTGGVIDVDLWTSASTEPSDGVHADSEATMMGMGGSAPPLSRQADFPSSFRPCVHQY